MSAFKHQVRVYYEDTDSGGVVYYANYLKFAERARTEWLRSLGFEQDALWEQHNIGFVVKRCAVEYHAPAKLDDALDVTCIVAQKRKAGFVIRQQVMRGDDLLVELGVTIICVNKALRPTRLPQEMASILASDITA